mgnify:CR=1 FL=1
MTTKNLQKLIVSLRKSKENTKKLSDAISWYTDWQCDFRGDMELDWFLYDLIDSEYWEYSMEMISSYIDKWKYEIIDRDKVPTDIDWNKKVLWTEKKQYIKEIITDDDRFIEYFTSYCNVKQTIYDAIEQWTYNMVIYWTFHNLFLFIGSTLMKMASKRRESWITSKKRWHLVILLILLPMNWSNFVLCLIIIWNFIWPKMNKGVTECIQKSTITW